MEKVTIGPFIPQTLRTLLKVTFGDEKPREKSEGIWVYQFLKMRIARVRRPLLALL